MKKWITDNRLYIFGAIAGAAGGFLYWKFIGCHTGTCAITSSPLNSTLYFAVMGAAFMGLFRREKKWKETPLPEKKDGPMPSEKGRNLDKP